MCGKMAEELLSLKWNNHQAHFVDILTFLREQEIFVDATLACGGKLYAAHKFVLSTCSDYFKQMFTKNPSKHPIVFMKDVTSRDLEALLDFMYNGEVNVPQSSLGSLIKTAEGLQIKGLAVPDDPPAPKRERDREKRENRTQLDHHHHHSPPAKRPRPRERSPPHSSPSQQPPVQVPSSNPVSRSRSPAPPVTPVGASQLSMPPVEATLDEDSRTSIQSGVSGPSEQNSSTTPSLSSKQTSGSASSQAQQQQQNQDDTAQHQDSLGHGPGGGEEPSPGPSGLHKPQQPQQSKEEPEFEIKQEDVVELGEDDEGDWGVEGDGGGGESSIGTENPPNFPEVMLPHSDGSLPPSGDPAMATALEQILRGSTLSPPLAPTVKNEPCDTSPEQQDPLEHPAVSGSGPVETTPHRYLQALPRLSGLAGNLGMMGLSSPSNLPSLTNPAGLVSVIMTPSPTQGATRPQRRSNNPIKCPVCGRFVLFRSEFVKHMRTHTGEKPFGCHLCAYRSAQRSNLNVHLRSIHKVFHPPGSSSNGGQNVVFISDTSSSSQQPQSQSQSPFSGNPDTSFI